MVDGWNKEIDALLTFVSMTRLGATSYFNLTIAQAGLFSGILTAFTIESYQLLFPQPVDPTIALLSQIAVHLTNSPVQASGRLLSEDQTSSHVTPPLYAILLNVL